jgi:predicted N-acyltransferase
VTRTTISGRKKEPVFVHKHTLDHPAGWLPVAAGYEMQLFVNAEEIPDEEWNALNHTGNLFTGLEYLRGLQFTAPPEMGFAYVILRKGKKNIAGYVFQSIHLSKDVLADVLEPLTNQKTFVGNMSEWFRRCCDETGIRVLISGNNFVSGEHGVITAKGSDPAEAFAMMGEVIKVLVRAITKPIRISIILVKDYYAADKNTPHSLLKRKRYHAFGVEPEMIVDIREDWSTFADYIASMSKKYRNRAKTVLKHSEELVQQHLSKEELDRHIDVLYPMYMDMHAKARFRLAALTPEYFLEMKRRFPGKFAVVMYTLKGKAVAFRTFFLNGDQLEAHFIGVNYSLNKQYDLYQRILYDFVDDSIRTKRKELLLGRTAGEIKSTIGAVAHDFTCYIRHRNSIHNQVIRPFIDYLRPSEWTPRNPFREDA